ncbi:type IV secretory system conjugative DNA transfer family protein [Klebsiella variicola]|nr:type IV secretory system conjugative DNA transfer family protein [Klebsiella variicola]
MLPEHDSTLKHQCLMLMDEFAVMGPINIMKTVRP